MIDGRPTSSGEFSFSGPHTVIATTWRESGALESTVTVSVDLEAAFDNVPPE